MSFPGQPPMYDPEAVKPMREELVLVGCDELTTAEAVDKALSPENKGVALLMVNSVCGCAAGSARPGVMLSLQHEKIPDHLYTVFAGMDRDATEKARSYMKDIPPSSPCVALFKDGALLGVIPRQHIEGRGPEEIAEALKRAYDEHCTREGPSIPREEFEKIVPQHMCGSQLPRFDDPQNSG